MQSQKAVSAYFTSKHMLPFGFAEQCVWRDMGSKGKNENGLAPQHQSRGRPSMVELSTVITGFFLRRGQLPENARRWTSTGTTLDQRLVFAVFLPNNITTRNDFCHTYLLLYDLNYHWTTSRSSLFNHLYLSASSFELFSELCVKLLNWNCWKLRWISQVLC